MYVPALDPVMMMQKHCQSPYDETMNKLPGAIELRNKVILNSHMRSAHCAKKWLTYRIHLWLLGEYVVVEEP